MSSTSEILPTLNHPSSSRRYGKLRSMGVRPKRFFSRLARPVMSFYRANRGLSFAIMALLSSGFSILLAFVLAETLLLSDTDFTITNQDTPSRISLAGNLVAVDTTANTFTIDWYIAPPEDDCSSDPLVANIYLDQNLLDGSSPGMDAGSSQPSTPGNPSSSTAPSTSVMFQYIATEACGLTQVLQDSKNMFRTIAKLADTPGSTSSSSTLQAYPRDQYMAQISMFALDNVTGASVPLSVDATWGMAVNFQVQLDRTDSYDGADGLYLLFNVSRSAAVQLFVYCVVFSNWMVTAAFLWLTIANMLWHSEKIIKEMFVLPVTSLFAFTTIRANLPGAPVGFGAYIDVVGILPNLVIITVCSALLLLLVLARRVSREIKLKALNDAETNEKNGSHDFNEKKEEEEADRLIAAFTRRMIREIALEEYRKKDGKENASYSESSDEEEGEEKDQNIMVLCSKNTDKVRDAEEGRRSKKGRSPATVLPVAFAESSTYKLPLDGDA